MGYKTTTNVLFNGRDLAAGKPIRFTEEQEADRIALLGCGAIEEAASRDDDEPGEDLDRMKRDDLVALAAKEGATHEEKATKAAIIVAIEGARAKKAEADAGGSGGQSMADGTPPITEGGGTPPADPPKE